ncbi:MAG: NAD(P)H-binding protein [Blastocatellia bacterium]
MKPILIIGATGNIGRQVITQLLAAQVRVRALTRNPEAADLPAEVELVRGDLAAPETLNAVLAEVERVFIVWTAPLTAVAPAIERIARYAPHVVLFTAPHQTPHPFFQQPNPIATLHKELERRVQEAGLRHTILRPGMFALNAKVWWSKRIRAGTEVIHWPYADAATQPTDERDMGAVAVRALCEAGHEGKNYIITGPQSLTQAEQVRILGEAIGRPLRLEEITPEEARTELQTVIPAPAINMLLNAWQAALGQPAYVTSTVEEITGRPAHTFREWASHNAAAFRR